jgi:hypothetical protein
MELKLIDNEHNDLRLLCKSQAKLTLEQILDLLETVTNDAELLELKTELGELL